MKTLLIAWFVLANLSVMADDSNASASGPWTDGYTPEIRAEAAKICDDLTAMLHGADTSDAAWKSIDDRISAYIRKYGSMGGHTDNNMEIAKDLQLQVAEQGGIAAKMDQPVDIKFTAADGTQVDVSQMTGKVVLVQFWSADGQPDAVTKQIAAVYPRYHDKGLEVVGLCAGYDTFAAKDFLGLWIVGKSGKVYWLDGMYADDGTETGNALEEHIKNFLAFH